MDQRDGMTIRIINPREEQRSLSDVLAGRQGETWRISCRAHAWEGHMEWGDIGQAVLQHVADGRIHGEGRHDLTIERE